LAKFVTKKEQPFAALFAFGGNYTISTASASASASATASALCLGVGEAG